MEFKRTLASLFLFSGVLLSCTEPMTPRSIMPAPASPRPPEKISLEMQRLPPDTAILPAEPGSPITVSIYPFVEGILVDVKILGQITLNSHSRAAPINYSGPLDYKGVRVPFGNGCLLQATVVFSQISGGGNPFPNTVDCLIPREMSDYTVRALVGGTGTAVRSPKPSGNAYPCDSIRASGDQCYIATGQQMIVVTPLAAALDFRGTYGGKRSHGLFVPKFVNGAGQTVNGYHSVVFTDSTISRGMPLRNNSHTWDFGDPLDPGDTWWHKTQNTCTNGVLYCSVNIKETGTMRSDTRVNGTYQTDAVTIYCEDTIPVFNYDLVRQGMMAVNDSSGYPSQQLSNRVERVFLTVQDSVTPGTVLPMKEYIVKGNEVLVLDPTKPEGSELLPGGSFKWPVTGRCTWPKRSVYRPEMQ